MRIRSLVLAVFLLMNANHSSAAERLSIVTENWAPHSFEEKGVVKGGATKIVRKVLEHASLDYKIEVLPWARAYKTAQKDENVLIYALGRNAAREGNFKWLLQVIPSNHAYLYKLKSRTDIKV